jgi:acetolactate synthase-1/2/3 large subunit
MTAAQLLVRCLEAEDVRWVFGLPGEENLRIVNALAESAIKFITTRHEQGAAFMANVHGRLTGRAGVCLSTLGPGATNLVTGVADANTDRAALVAIAGQADTTRMHKESHQVVDLLALFRPITKFAVQIREPEIVAEATRKAFKIAQTEKPGACFIEIPDNVAAMEVATPGPLKVQAPAVPLGTETKLKQIAHMLSAARAPAVIVGNGAIRQRAVAALVEFVERLGAPIATTFMAKGAVPASHPLCAGVIGTEARDPAALALEAADVVVCVGYDMVEFPPSRWNPRADKRIVHIDTAPAEVDTHYQLEAGVVGDIADALTRIGRHLEPRAPRGTRPEEFHDVVEAVVRAYSHDTAFPVKPQRVCWDLRQALAPDDIVIADVGAHKLWIARMYHAERPNTCIISNGFAAMGIAVPGAVAAKLVYPDRAVVAVTGDGGFLMNSQELETARRVGAAVVVLVLRDDRYALVDWHQARHFQRPLDIGFNNPDLVRYAESFGVRGYRISRAEDLVSTLRRAIDAREVAVIDCPIDWTENHRLAEPLTVPGSATSGLPNAGSG